MLVVARRVRSPSRSWSALSPKQVWCRVRGTWDCRCEHEPQIRSCCTGYLPGGSIVCRPTRREEVVEQIHDRVHDLRGLRWRSIHRSSDRDSGLKVEGVPSAGGVLVLRGSVSGLVEQNRLLLTQASPGVPDEPEVEDGFGSVLAAANLGRGPQDDLVVGVPDEDLESGVYDGGQVHVLYGSTAGVDATSSQVWRQNSPGIEGHAGDSDSWGSQLVTGDFDGSSYADLAIGSPSDHYHETLEHGSGTVQVLHGSAAGLTAVGSQRWSAAMPTLAGRGHAFGFPEGMAAGDFDADGCDDLALTSIGGPRFDTAGSVTVLYGSRLGLAAARAQTCSQDSVGIAGAPGDSEWFGSGLAVGDFGRRRL